MTYGPTGRRRYGLTCGLGYRGFLRLEFFQEVAESFQDGFGAGYLYGEFQRAVGGELGFWLARYEAG